MRICRDLSLFLQTTRYILMKDARDERLVRDTFFQGFFLQGVQAFGGYPNIDQAVLPRCDLGVI